MASIAFFLDLGRFANTLRTAQLEYGNPGIGGTPYLFLLTAKYLNKLYGPDYAILLSDIDFMLNDSDIILASVNDEKGALIYCKKHGIDLLVLNANMTDRVSMDFYDTDIKIILWAHNTVNGNSERIVARQKAINRIVCVSQQQYENMRDTVCFNKCTFINNVIPRAFVESAVISNYSEKKVVYVGSIMPQKGAHNLLRIWKFVEKKMPDAELFIFGGAKVWDPALECGCLGIGDVFYDSVLNKELHRLKKPENVHFMGAKGWKEIEQEIKTFKVGVVNPSHYLRDETFCMSAIELAAHGIPVVSRDRKDGLLSTIKHNKTGFLEKTDKKIANRIVELLDNYELCRKLGDSSRNFSKGFIIEKEIYKWKDIVENRDVNSAQNIGIKISRDALYLLHDYLLKVVYTILSGKAIYLLKNRLKISADRKKQA